MSDTRRWHRSQIYRGSDVNRNESSMMSRILNDIGYGIITIKSAIQVLNRVFSEWFICWTVYMSAVPDILRSRYLTIVDDCY